MRSVKSRRVNSKWSERNLLIKGMGDEILIGLFHIMPKKHPLLIKRIETTLLDRSAL